MQVATSLEVSDMLSLQKIAGGSLKKPFSRLRKFLKKSPGKRKSRFWGRVWNYRPTYRNCLTETKISIRFSFVLGFFFFKMGVGVKFYFLFFLTTLQLEMGGWNYIDFCKPPVFGELRIYFHNSLQLYYEKSNVVYNNQNSLERAYVELKKVNISIIKYPLFSVSLRTLLDKKKKKKSHQFILFCVIFPFLSNALFSINGFCFQTQFTNSIFFFISQQLPRFLPTGKLHRFINRPWIKYI